MVASLVAGIAAKLAIHAGRRCARRRVQLSCCAALVLCAPLSLAAPAADAGPAAAAARATPAPLKVAVAGSPPFVTAVEIGASAAARHPKASGMSIEVWERAARELGRSYVLVPASSVQDAVDRVSSGEVDLAVGPISITAARAEQVAFSQPYFASSLGILAPARESLFDHVKPFVTRAFIGGVGVLLLVLLFVGTLTWALERRTNPDQFPRRPVAGIGNGIWMALVTMTTVGYGDRVPRTVAGRVVTGIWMTMSMFVASSLTASLATAFTLSQIDRPAIGSASDLENRRVGAIRGTTSVPFARNHEAQVVEAPSLAVAVAALQQGETAAVVFDHPALRYFLLQHPDLELRIATAQYQPQGYGFALPFESELRAPLDVVLLRLQSSGELDQIVDKWLGP